MNEIRCFFYEMSLSDIINSVVALAAVGTIVLTLMMIRESRLMRLFQTTPEIIIHLEYAEASPSLLFIVVENIGAGTARNVKLDLVKDYGFYNDFDIKKLGDRGIFKTGLNNFYPKQRFKYFISSTDGDYEKKCSDYLIVDLSYDLINGKSCKRNYKLYIEEYLSMGMFTPGDTHIRQISYRIEKIQKDFEKLTEVIIKSNTPKEEEE
ncbi:MAG: hypothetical protein ACH34V_05735 [Flavobacterium sp.]|uniref:hypothetical protein n=1 Tax=Flavobacterium sp. TaxID=239 RepID=UPI0037B97CFB